MPVYCFTADDGETIEELFAIGKAPETITRRRGKKQVEYHRDFGAEGRGFINTPGNWPMYSDSLGCHPRQVKQMQALLQSKGVHAEFNAQGRPKLENARHRAAVCRALGKYDRNAGYSDPAPIHYNGPIEQY